MQKRTKRTNCIRYFCCKLMDGEISEIHLFLCKNDIIYWIMAINLVSVGWIRNTIFTLHSTKTLKSTKHGMRTTIFLYFFIFTRAQNWLQKIINYLKNSGKNKQKRNRNSFASKLNRHKIQFLTWLIYINEHWALSREFLFIFNSYPLN